MSQNYVFLFLQSFKRVFHKLKRYSQAIAISLVSIVQQFRYSEMVDDERYERYQQLQLKIGSQNCYMSHLSAEKSVDTIS